MALTAEEKQLCAEWLTEPARKWQVLNRSQWKYQFREKTLVRFVEEATMDEGLVPLLLEYLTSDDCKSTIQLYGQAVSSEWVPTRAWYEISNKAVGNLKAVRLYHALSIGPENGEDGPYLIEDGCAYRVSWTNYWKRENVQQVPKSTSGVSYRIVNLQRDPDTGLFSYSIEKRERVQQDIEEYLTRSTAFEDVSEEVHMGVRGDPSLGGKPASVANGKTVTRKVTKNADCTHDVHNTITQDKAAPGAVVTTEVGVRGTTVTTENRNMPTPASAENLAPGESVRNQQTDSKLWNQTIKRFVRNVFVWLRGTCRKTIFDHSHSKTTNVKENPGFSHVEEAGNGVIHELTVQKTVEGYDITESTTEEKPVSNAIVSQKMTLNGLVVQRTHRNQPRPAISPTKIGTGVMSRKTNGGLYDVTETEEGTTPAGKTNESCLHDAFAHHHVVTNNEAEPQDVETEFMPGKIVRKTAIRTSNGTANNSVDTTTAIPKINRYTYTRDDGAVVHVLKYRNQQGIPDYPNGAVGLNINDSINTFELHDGVISYLTNAPYRISFGDLKFIKHGASQKFYEIVYNRRTRRFKHRVWTVQVHHIKGDAYTDYVSDWQRADINRTTSGVMCTRLISRYRDKDGNELAEWKWVELTQPPGGAWVICTQSCGHQWKEFSQEDFRKAAKALLAGGGDAGADEDKFHKDLVATLKDIPLATAAAMQGMTLQEKRDEIAKLEEARKGANAK